MSLSQSNTRDDDPESVVGVLTAFATSLFLISVPIRVYVKGKPNMYGLDDAFYFGAVVSFLVTM